jgi:hypothetical protein
MMFFNIFRVLLPAGSKLNKSHGTPLGNVEYCLPSFISIESTGRLNGQAL